METEEELQELAVRLEQLAIAIVVELKNTTGPRVGVWGREHADVLRRACRILRMKGEQ